MDFKSQSLSIAIGVLKDGGITDIAYGSQNPECQTDVMNFLWFSLSNGGSEMGFRAWLWYQQVGEPIVLMQMELRPLATPLFMVPFDKHHPRCFDDPSQGAGAASPPIRAGYRELCQMNMCLSRPDPPTHF